MLAAIIVLAVVAGILTVLLVVERRRRTQQEAAAQSEIQRLLADAESTAGSLAEATARADTAEAVAEEAAAVAEAASARAVEADDERQAAFTDLAGIRSERDSLAQELAAAVAEAEAAGAGRDAALAEATALRERLELSDARVRDEDRPGLDAAALWALELSRSERTWRHSVAPAPDAENPFPTAGDPLRLAVEVEVSALREDVGAAMELEWDVHVDDPARRMLVLRMVQELLAIAAREQQAVILRGSDGDGAAAVLHLTVPEGHPPLAVVPPPLGDHLVTVDDTDGLRITIH